MEQDEVSREIVNLRRRMHDLVETHFQPLILRVTLLERTVDAVKGLDAMVDALTTQVALMNQTVNKLDWMARGLVGTVLLAVAGALLTLVLRR